MSSVIIQQGAHVTTTEFLEQSGDYVRSYSINAHASLTYYVHTAANFSGSFAITFNLQGEGARVTVRGLYMLTDNQQVTITTTQNHNAPHTHSDLLIKGLVAGNAQAQYRGTIYVSPDATHANALQYNKNMLLSGAARAQSIPSLEVLTNDVRCMHGSAVGQLHADQLYYLQSRGVEYHDAKRILLAGFCADVVTMMDEHTVRARIDDLIKESNEKSAY